MPIKVDNKQRYFSVAVPLLSNLGPDVMDDYLYNPRLFEDILFWGFGVNFDIKMDEDKLAQYHKAKTPQEKQQIKDKLDDPGYKAEQIRIAIEEGYHNLWWLKGGQTPAGRNTIKAYHKQSIRYFLHDLIGRVNSGLFQDIYDHIITNADFSLIQTTLESYLPRKLDSYVRDPRLLAKHLQDGMGHNFTQISSIIDKIVDALPDKQLSLFSQKIESKMDHDFNLYGFSDNGAGNKFWAYSGQHVVHGPQVNDFFYYIATNPKQLLNFIIRTRGESHQEVQKAVKQLRSIIEFHIKKIQPGDKSQIHTKILESLDAIESRSVTYDPKQEDLSRPFAQMRYYLLSDIREQNRINRVANKAPSSGVKLRLVGNSNVEYSTVATDMDPAGIRHILNNINGGMIPVNLMVEALDYRGLLGNIPILAAAVLGPGDQLYLGRNYLNVRSGARYAPGDNVIPYENDVTEHNYQEACVDLLLQHPIFQDNGIAIGREPSFGHEAQENALWPMGIIPDGYLSLPHNDTAQQLIKKSRLDAINRYPWLFDSSHREAASQASLRYPNSWETTEALLRRNFRELFPNEEAYNAHEKSRHAFAQYYQQTRGQSLSLFPDSSEHSLRLLNSNRSDTSLASSPRDNALQQAIFATNIQQKFISAIRDL